MIKKGDLLDELPKIQNRLLELEDTSKVLENLMSGQNIHITKIAQKQFELEKAVKKLIDIVVPKEETTSTPVQKKKTPRKKK